MEITEFPNYLIHNDGRVENKTTGRILKPRLGTSKYLEVRLGKNAPNRTIHRLVAEAYIPNPHHLPQVDHKDRNKTNNNIENLRWVNNSQNSSNRKLKGSIWLTNYGSYCASWYPEPNIRKSKNFQTEKEAQEFLEQVVKKRNSIDVIDGDQSVSR